MDDPEDDVDPPEVVVLGTVVPELFDGLLLELLLDLFCIARLTALLTALVTRPKIAMWLTFLSKQKRAFRLFKSKCSPVPIRDHFRYFFSLSSSCRMAQSGAPTSFKAAMLFA